jgi:hypothetical protein|tara:strand:- start:12474 stop:13799 length:1326 start_codon:yes stop_codon:yes gene_type:complete
MGQTRMGLTPTETRRFDVDRPKDWKPSIRSQEEVDDLWWERMLNKGQRASNTFMDMFAGSTPQEEAEIGLDPSNMVGGAMLSMNSPLRDPVYRSRMIKEFLEMVEQLGIQEGSMEAELANQFRGPLRRLAETHPRMVAAFQHSGGRVKTPPRHLTIEDDALGTYSNPDEMWRSLTPSKQAEAQAVSEALGGGNARASKGFTSFSGRPEVQLRAAVNTRPASEIVPHEFAHFAQDLRGQGARRATDARAAHHALDQEFDMKGTWDRFREGGGGFAPARWSDEEMKFIRTDMKPGTAPMTDEQWKRHIGWSDEGRRIRDEGFHRELGAERTATKQRERFERWRRGETDWDQYKGIGMDPQQPASNIAARHVTGDQLLPGKRQHDTAIRNRWNTEQKAMAKRRAQLAETRRQERVENLGRANRRPRRQRSEGVRRPLLNFWPFN